MKKLALALLFAASVSPVFAGTEVVNGIEWEYEIDAGGAILLGILNTTTGAISIPTTLGGCPVTSIGGCAFENCSGLTSVTIPSSVTSIGYGAFSGCYRLTSVAIPSSVTSIDRVTFSRCHGLTSVSIPSSVTSIGDQAFDGCSKLTSVTIPSSVTSIGYEAFYGCSKLTSVTIPSSVTSIGEGAFRGCSGLTSIVLASGNPAYRSANGVLLSADGTTIVAVPGGRKTITIPDGVTSIGHDAFEDCYELTSVTIPSSVTSIGYGAFYGCYGLTSIAIPDGVTSIGTFAFGYCHGLTSVTIPSSVTSIGEDAFYGCDGLTAVHISDVAAWCGIAFGNSSSDMDDFANPLTSAHRLFLNGEEIKTLVVPDGVKSIGDKAFYGCSGLTSVTIPSSVTSIGEGTFRGCSGLTSIVLASGNPAYRSANGVLLSADGTTIVAVPGGRQTITIPDGVTSIGEGAFRGCSGLTSVTIPSSVTSIGGWAFFFCRGLTSVTIPDGVTSIGVEAFYGCSGLKSVTLPSSVKSIGFKAFPAGCKVFRPYTVKFAANGGTGKMSAQTMHTGKAARLRKNAFKRSGCLFLGWAKTKTGAVAYKNGAAVKNLAAAGKSVTLYARWAKKIYRVKFCHTYKNETGKAAVQKFAYGKAKRLAKNKFKRKGYVFKGWAKSKALAKKGKVAFKNRKKVKNLVANGKTVKLYAVWKKKKK